MLLFICERCGACEFPPCCCAAAGGAHRGIGALQLRSLLRCRAQSNMLASQLRLRQSYWRACPCCVTGTLNAAKGLTAAAGAASAPRLYVFYLACLHA